MRTIATNDDDYVKLLKSFIELNAVHDDDGRLMAFPAGIPPVPYIFEVLFNISLSDIDMGIEKQLPKLKYLRYQHEILIPIYTLEYEPYIISKVYDIFNECDFIKPDIERAVRGGAHIPIAGGSILINNDGSCKIIKDLS